MRACGTLALGVPFLAHGGASWGFGMLRGKYEAGSARGAWLAAGREVCLCVRGRHTCACGDCLEEVALSGRGLGENWQSRGSAPTAQWVGVCFLTMH